MGAEPHTRPDGKGGFHIALLRDVLDKLKALRGHGESYSDVIVRVQPYLGWQADNRCC
jgi:hypothetical protein